MSTTFGRETSLTSKQKADPPWVTASGDIDERIEARRNSARTSSPVSSKETQRRELETERQGFEFQELWHKRQQESKSRAASKFGKSAPEPPPWARQQEKAPSPQKSAFGQSDSTTKSGAVNAPPWARQSQQQQPSEKQTPEVFRGLGSTGQLGSPPWSKHESSQQEKSADFPWKKTQSGTRAEKPAPPWASQGKAQATVPPWSKPRSEPKAVASTAPWVKNRATSAATSDVFESKTPWEAKRQSDLAAREEDASKRSKYDPFETSEGSPSEKRSRSVDTDVFDKRIAELDKKIALLDKKTREHEERDRRYRRDRSRTRSTSRERRRRRSRSREHSRERRRDRDRHSERDGRDRSHAERTRSSETFGASGKNVNEPAMNVPDENRSVMQISFSCFEQCSQTLWDTSSPLLWGETLRGPLLVPSNQ